MMYKPSSEQTSASARRTMKLMWPMCCAVPVRTVGEQAYRIRELRVRFFRADMMFKPSPEAADEYLKGVVNAAGRESSSTAVPDVLTALRNGEMLLTTPERLSQEITGPLSLLSSEPKWRSVYDHPTAHQSNLMSLVRRWFARPAEGPAWSL